MRSNSKDYVVCPIYKNCQLLWALELNLCMLKKIKKTISKAKNSLFDNDGNVNVSNFNDRCTFVSESYGAGEIQEEASADSGERSQDRNGQAREQGQVIFLFVYNTKIKFLCRST